MQELEKQGELVQLDCDLETLGLLGTTLSNAVVTTLNEAAFITASGGYGRYRSTAMPHRLSHSRVNLRFAPDISVRVALYTPDASLRQSLLISDLTGKISHRIETTDDFDKALLRSIEPSQDTPNYQIETPKMPEVISLAAVRNARMQWDSRDTGQQLNDILNDAGRTRRTILPHVGSNRARPILPQVLMSFFSYIMRNRVRHVQQVPSHGLIQSALVQSGNVELVNNLVLLHSCEQTMAIDQEQIESIWVTQTGPLSLLEIYGDDGRAIASFGADPNSDIRRWNDLLASLPPPSFNSIRQESRHPLPDLDSPEL